MTLAIKKGGKLFKTKWVYDEEKDEGGYVTTDVTDEAPTRLFNTCTLDDDVTLKDILLLLNTNLGIFDLIIGNWCKEIVEEGLKKQPIKEDKIEYLELYWCVVRDKIENKDTFSENIFPRFHGHGYEDKNGQRTPYGIAFSPVNQLVNLSLKLSNEYVIINDMNWKEEPKIYKGPSYSLGHILYGVIWELSFHGDPINRDKIWNNLMDIKEEVDSKYKENK